MNEIQYKTLKMIQGEEKNGNIVFAAADGIRSCSIEEFIKQCAEGILFDLNRDKVTTITLADSKVTIGTRWINDYAVSVTIIAMKAEIDRLSAIIESNNQCK